MASSGWQAGWTKLLPENADALKAALKCDASSQTWSDSPAANEQKPINCVTWYEAFAFCLWDGARLPTEAEWNLAASGGTNYRVYPWSTPSASTSIDKTRAAYACSGDNNGATCALSDIVNVGTLTAGYARWGQADLAGNIWEYVLDYWSTTLPYPCSNCANVTVDSGWRGIHGGSWLTFTTANLASAARDRGDPLGRSNNVGFRCARD